MNALAFKGQLAQAHLRNAVRKEKNYAVPHTIDMSVMLYNVDLYTKAGLDPAKPPKNLNEFAEHARKIDALGGGVNGDVNGTYVGGSCGGNCGRLQRLHPLAYVFALYRKLYEEGVAAPAAKDEAGPTWLGALQGGKIGIAPGPSVWLGLIEEKGVKMKNKGVPFRTDLAANKYSSAAPRIVAINNLVAKGRTPE